MINEPQPSTEANAAPPETAEALPLTETLVMDALREILDPELGCSIVDLGLIYSVDIRDRHVTVTMTLTTPGCPMQERLARAAKIAVLRLDPVEQAEVRVVWDPPWNPAMMSESLRAKFGAAFGRGCGG